MVYKNHLIRTTFQKFSPYRALYLGFPPQRRLPFLGGDALPGTADAAQLGLRRRGFGQIDGGTGGPHGQETEQVQNVLPFSPHIFICLFVTRIIFGIKRLFGTSNMAPLCADLQTFVPHSLTPMKHTECIVYHSTSGTTGSARTTGSGRRPRL